MFETKIKKQIQDATFHLLVPYRTMSLKILDTYLYEI